MGDVYVLSRDGKPHSQLPANIANHPFNNVLYIVVEGKGRERERNVHHHSASLGGSASIISLPTPPDLP
jgi:hypothetical protein